ncbi:EpsG family protein [Dokdonia sp. Hel_I_53]|uniref:EpsG family protein n=1 Tax=Dokdonia sp. Hel_I_53 TaxID=1566287 RepID=UPI00119A5B98|nr:EpsG family protein [Dokdonia sp. Hel_I_53]TVZ51342.1 EpsG-like putative glucosyltransferase [Dokdonia sp. Hel_I_53]
MVIYYVYIIYCLILTFLSKVRDSGIGDKKLTFLLGGGLLLLMGLRHRSVGNDVIRYLERYKDVERYFTLETKTESGYMIFQKILSLMNISPQGFIFTVSLIILILFSWFFYKYSKNIGMSFFLHFTVGLFAFTMTGIRQSIAIGLTLIAIHLALQKKLIWYILIILLATLFHQSAIVFAPVYIIFQIRKYNFKIIFLIFLAILVIGVFNEIIFNQIFSLSANKYNTQYLDTADESRTSFIFIVFSFSLPAIIMFLWFLDNIRIRELSKIDISFFIMSLIGCVFILLSSQLSLLSRLSYYFMIGIIVLIPNTIKNLKNRPVANISSFFLTLISIAYFIIANVDGISKIDSYLFFWE